jgi:hypothetical protein
MDNQETHKPASLYETFPAEKAKNLRDRSEFALISKHGNWLNMTKMELNVLTKQCLGK